MKKYIILTLILFCSSLITAYELNMLIDNPTAGILQRGEAEISAKLYKNNGLNLGTRIGLFPRFMFGVNYGAEQVVGNQEPDWHDRVEFNAKFRIMDESYNFPAIAIGYDSQGHGNYYKDLKRYDIKSKGVYLVLSKNYAFLGNLGFHLGANYSLEDEDKDEDPNFYAGVDKSIGDVLVLIGEYDLAWNDNDNWDQQTMGDALNGLGKGYLNASLDIHFTDYLVLKLSMYDILRNRRDTKGCDRTLTLLYFMTF